MLGLTCCIVLRSPRTITKVFRCSFWYPFIPLIFHSFRKFVGYVFELPTQMAHPAPLAEWGPEQALEKQAVHGWNSAIGATLHGWEIPGPSTDALLGVALAPNLCFTGAPERICRVWATQTKAAVFLKVSWGLLNSSPSWDLHGPEDRAGAVIRGAAGPEGLGSQELTREHPIFHASHVRIFSVQQRFLHLNREKKNIPTVPIGLSSYIISSCFP